MKCIHCLYDSRLRERQTFACPKCGRPFALNPAERNGWTDYLFFQAIQRVSNGGAVKFADGHLYQEIRRRRGGAPSKGLLYAALIVFTPLSLVLFLLAGGSMAASLVAMLLVAIATTTLLWHYRKRPLESPWQAYASARWAYFETHGRPEAWIEPRPAAPALSASAPALPEHELAHYSFDRAVICDRPATVDLLIANQFHFENNCAVLGVGGYPPERFELVRRMLRNNPRLLVLALHDASVDGCRLAHRLRTDPEWFRDYGSVVDVGLRPAHHKFFPRLHEEVEGHLVMAGEGLSEEEARWLQRYRLSLDVVLPEQIIKRLFKAITVVEQRSIAHDTTDAGTGADGGGADLLLFGVSAEASDGGGDSFG